MIRYLASAVLGAALIGSAYTLGYHSPPAERPAAGDFAPDPRPVADRVYQLPAGEMVPLEILVQTEPGDVSDWGHKNLDIPAAWKVTKGKGAVVAVLDTGIDHDHRDLKGRLKGSRDFTGSRSGDNDVNGHGTHCAGVVAAEANGTGMVGVAPESMILAGKVLGDRGSGTSSGIAKGIDWAVENGADVISMSLGGSSPDPQTQAAVRRAVARGVIVVAAAGNSGPRDGTIGYPGGYPEVICVGATDSDDRVADFSSRGDRLDVAAPGVRVKSCYPGDRFATMSGTSMATPYVAGVAALYVADAKAKGKKPDPAEFRKLLTGTAKDLPPSGKDTASGFGLAQPAKFLSGSPGAPPVDGDAIVITPDPNLPILVGGRKVKRIVLELEPLTPAPMPLKPVVPPGCPDGKCPLPRVVEDSLSAWPGLGWVMDHNGKWVKP